MAEYLEFKSKVVNLHDHRSFDLSEYLPSFEIDYTKLDKDMKRALKAGSTQVEAETVSEDDVVELDLQSDIPKYNRNSLMITVGKGLYNRDLENMLIGRNAGDDITAVIDESDVKVSIKKIKHYVIPEFSAEEMKSIRKDCIDRQIDNLLDEGEAADMASAMICRCVSENSEFHMDDEEVTAIMELADRKLENFDDYDDEFDKIMREITLNAYKTAIIGNHMAKKNGQLLTIDDYERSIENRLPYYEGMTAEEVKKEYPLYEYMQTAYGDVYIKYIDEYVAEEFKKVLNEEY
ncbi:MAG: hypothetical protein PUB87_01665 [Eubacteriaceae bacterium]|nr:hypothetical protein [Eubacteriaceae bacterium]